MAHATRVPNTPSPAAVAAHRLVIEPVLAGKAHCTCGGWFYDAIGATTSERILSAFGAHGFRRTVYVVAWDSEGSGGFDWYFDQATAAAAFENEKRNVDSEPYKNEGWTAYYFGFITSVRADEQTVTDEIDADFRCLCEEATKTYGPGARGRLVESRSASNSTKGDAHDPT